LAADLKTQLDKVTSAGQQAEAKKRAAAWKEARNANKEKPVVAAGPAVPPTSPGGKTGATGCPGWPFPTLPCTEQFPALPGPRAAPPAAAAGGASLTPPKPVKAPIEELNESLTEIYSASLRGQYHGGGCGTGIGTG